MKKRLILLTLFTASITGALVINYNKNEENKMLIEEVTLLSNELTEEYTKRLEILGLIDEIELLLLDKDLIISNDKTTITNLIQERDRYYKELEISQVEIERLRKELEKYKDYDNIVNKNTELENKVKELEKELESRSDLSTDMVTKLAELEILFERVRHTVYVRPNDDMCINSSGKEVKCNNETAKSTTEAKMIDIMKGIISSQLGVNKNDITVTFKLTDSSFNLVWNSRKTIRFTNVTVSVKDVGTYSVTVILYDIDSFSSFSVL